MEKNKLITIITKTHQEKQEFVKNVFTVLRVYKTLSDSSLSFIMVIFILKYFFTENVQRRLCDPRRQFFFVGNQFPIKFGFVSMHANINAKLARMKCRKNKVSLKAVNKRGSPQLRVPPHLGGGPHRRATSGECDCFN